MHDLRLFQYYSNVDVQSPRVLEHIAMERFVHQIQSFTDAQYERFCRNDAIQAGATQRPEVVQFIWHRSSCYYTQIYSQLFDIIYKRTAFWNMNSGLVS